MAVHLGPLDAKEELVAGLLLDEAEQHEGQGDVVRMERGLRGQLLDRDVAPAPHPRQVLQDHALPVAVIGHPAQVRQRLLRGPGLLLNLEIRIMLRC